MLALSPPMFSTNFGSQYYFPTEDSPIMGHFYRDLEPSFSSAPSLSLNFPAPPPSDQRVRAEIGSSEPMSGGDLNNAVKKLNHNASERDRRKKVNQLYSSLRGLLPASDHMKKMSIPATVSRVIKYIPELRQQVDGLVQKRDELLSRINSRNNNNHINNLQVKQETHNNNEIIKSTFATTSLPTVSASQLNDREVAVQISTHNNNNNVDNNNRLLSETLRNLEEDGLFVQNASSFESFGGRVFHNLHLQVKGSYSRAKCGTLGAKLNLGATYMNDEFLL